MSAPVMAGVAMATLALGLGVVAAAHTLEASARAAGAADAAALAAADAAVGYLEAVPCEIAGVVSAAVNATLESCEVHAASGQVRVRVSVQTIFGRAHAHARAGPEVA